MQYAEEKVPIKKHYYSVDSRLRNTDLFPNPNRYVVDIPTPFKNVIKVELVNAVYEKYGTENYLNLHIDELEDNLESNNNQVVGIYTQLPLIKPLNVYNGGQKDFRSIKLFERPIGKLGRLTISFRSFDGSLYPMQDHLMRFEIHCCKHSASIENRNLDLFSDFANVYVPSGAPFPSPATPMSTPSPLVPPHQQQFTRTSGSMPIPPPFFYSK
jgi:hypothetical protein